MQTRKGLAALAFWGGVIVALPNCTLDRSGIVAPQNFDRGAAPWTGAIFCEIEKPTRRCVSTLSSEELTGAIRLSEAAIALAEGRSSTVGIDDSPEAIGRCGDQGEAVFFEGPFPQGLPVCLNCDVIGGSGPYADAYVACRTKCYDFYGDTLEEGTYAPNIPPTPVVQAFCDANSRVAPNLELNACFGDACESGSLKASFEDPRRFAEPVIWTDFIGTASGGASGNDLTRTAATTFDFDAGAVSASEQWIKRGDAFVEFSVSQTNQAQAVGLSEIDPACAEPCPDTDPSVLGIDFGIALNFDGQIYIVERGDFLPDSFGVYSAGERFRVHVRDLGGGLASVTYVRVVGTCTPGTICNLVTIHTSIATPAAYPLRVDASMRDQTAALNDVRVVRIR